MVAYTIHWAHEFYILAAGVGLVMGGSQALSRSTYSKFLPETIDHASYFSFYDVSFYLSTVLGTFAYGMVYQLTADLRNTVIIIGSFFVVGLILLLMVPSKEVESHRREGVTAHYLRGKFDSMSDNATWDVVIVGGGIVGAATLYKLQTRFPAMRILLLEKENALADHQTGHNSGVIHSGIYYKPGSFKAKNCVTGRRELVAFAKEHGIKHDICGKLIVATDKDELPRLEKIHATGIANGIEDMERITAEQIKEIEPFCEGVAGVRVGCTGIIDFRGATEKMAEIALALQPESRVSLGEEFRGSEQAGWCH